jgi:hypothetical protein
MSSSSVTIRSQSAQRVGAFQARVTFIPTRACLQTYAASASGSDFARSKFRIRKTLQTRPNAGGAFRRRKMLSLIAAIASNPV